MRFLLPTVTGALLLLAPAALASGVVLTVASPEAQWQGAYFVLAATPEGMACIRLACDPFAFTVALDPDMPPPYPPLVASIAWASSEDDFDLYLYDGWDFLITSSTGRISRAETLVVDEIKPGDYTLVVAPTLVTDSAYAGSVGLVVE